MPALIVAYAIAAIGLATVWPLAVYSTSLALFGLAHVLSELRYVDARFGARFPLRFWARCAVPLLLIVGLRVLRLFDVIGNELSVGGEMALLTILVGIAVPYAWAEHRAGGVVGVVVVAALGLGSLQEPLLVLLTLAVLHNATPLGFVVERAPAGQRGRTLLLGSLLFFGVPLLVASGWPSLLLADVVDLDRTLLETTGPLVDHYPVYLWPQLREDVVAAQLFSAAVSAQLLHYAAVIFWLPRTLLPHEKPTLPWPRSMWFVVVVVALSLGLLVHFSIDFKGARALYGLVAALHAWIELPVLLAALSRRP
ncbi:MAG: hypothetical protein Q8O67_22405 [Deltaproteobacteria bacterium]|nr:hypothetical protein [Deltaproteobacteria bacterium]